MKRVYVLLVALLGLLGGAGYLYKTGYWDTWQDKKQELSDLLTDGFVSQGAPEDIASKIADCSSGKILDIFAQTDCKLQADDTIDVSIAVCAEQYPETKALVGMAILFCVEKILGDQEYTEGN